MNVKTARHAPLGDIIRRRGVQRIAYFHCDHFEPWRGPVSRGVEDNAADIARFAKQSSSHEFSRRLTLFYKAHIGFARSGRAKGGVEATRGDPFIFLPRPPTVAKTCRDAMMGLLAQVGHEIQVHVHHENYTYNTAHTDPDIIEAFSQPDSRRRDAIRFEFALRLGLAAMRDETGLAFDRWFFVHGQWGLNASDPSVCHITDEIEILMRNGALGDFTFPAGRPNVDPPLEQPYFVRPVNAARGYMLPSAEPEIAFGNTDAARRKFFIWASQIRHRGTSFDYYSDHVVQDLADPEGFARRILEGSFVAGGTLYFKTHAHSMHPKYAPDEGTGVFPHQHPGIQRMLGVLFDNAASAGVAVDFVTAGEVYDEFVRPRPSPEGGFALSLSGGLAALSTATPALEEDDLTLPFARTVNRAGAQFILGRLPDSRPALGFYETRARRGEVLAPYEERLARALLQEAPHQAVYEVGSGIAALPICLALNGVAAVAIEKDAARAAAAKAFLDQIAHDHPELTTRCEIRHSAAPAALREIRSENCALVFTNIAATLTAVELEELIALAAGFRTIIVDLSRFFELRDGAAQSRLLDRMIGAGWGPASPVSTVADNYWIFRKPTILDADCVTD